MTGCNLTDEFWQVRAEQLALMEQNAFTRCSGVMDDQGLDEFLGLGHVSSSSDFTGFVILFGFDEHGTDFVAVRNSVPGASHVVFVQASPRLFRQNRGK